MELDEAGLKQAAAVGERLRDLREGPRPVVELHGEPDRHAEPPA